MRNKIKYLNHLPATAPFIHNSITEFSLSFPHQKQGGQGMRNESSGWGLLTFFSCSSVVSFPKETVFHRLLQCESIPQAAVPHKLLQCASLLWDAVLQEQNCSSLSPLGGHNSCQQISSCVGSSLQRSTGLPRSPLQHGFSMWPWLQCGVLHRLEMNIFV